MNEFKKQISSTDVICPYCQHSYQPECENYSEEEYVVECENCGKKFFARQEFSVDHWTRPDCELNGEEHDFKQFDDSPISYHECTKCGKVKIVKQIQK